MTDATPPDFEPAEKFYTNGAGDQAPPPRAPPSGTAQAATPPTFDHLVTPVPAEWYTNPPPNRTWLLRDSRRPSEPGVLPLGKVGGFIAAGGVGKTMALIDLIIAVATGTPWLRIFSCPSPGRVLGLMGEEDKGEIHRRSFRVAQGRPRPEPGDIDPDFMAPAPEPPPTYPAAGDVVVLPLAGIPCALLERNASGNTSETTFLHWLYEFAVRAGPWRLIVLDPLSRFGGPDVEKDNAQGTRFIQVLEALATLTGATVIFSHHTTKAPGADSGRGGRGASSIFDGCRWEAMLEPQKIKLDDEEARERLGEVVVLSFTKSNYSRKAEPLLLRREDGGPLVPLDDVDRETVGKAQDRKAAKAETKKAEREQREAERAARDAAKKVEKATQEAAETTARHAKEEATLVAILREHPGALADELRTEMRARLDACSNGRTDAAIARLRLRGVVRIESRPNNGKAHFLKEPS
jgi:RecA-family ATPase